VTEQRFQLRDFRMSKQLFLPVYSGKGMGRRGSTPNGWGAVRRLLPAGMKNEGRLLFAPIRRRWPKRTGKGAIMKAIAEKRLPRSKCPSIHFLFRHDLTDCSEPPGSFSARCQARSDVFCRSTERGLALNCCYARPGHRRPGWDI